MSRNEIMEDLQDYMDGLEGDLQRALEREQALESEVARLNNLIMSMELTPVWNEFE